MGSTRVCPRSGTIARRHEPTRAFATWGDGTRKPLMKRLSRKSGSIRSSSWATIALSHSKLSEFPHAWERLEWRYERQKRLACQYLTCQAVSHVMKCHIE